ncbi:MAG TPA: hypothetical protein VK158_00705 [Acidobacteriota bacterium]|nr:hypothetical protein [Acidobacteriota bacterium]
MIGNKTTVTIDPELYEKAKSHCSKNKIKLDQFVEEAIIEKLIRKDIKQ